jgi:hypothetical protein
MSKYHKNFLLYITMYWRGGGGVGGVVVLYIHTSYWELHGNSMEIKKNKNSLPVPRPTPFSFFLPL